MNKIVIAGAGFAGVQAALTIAKAAKNQSITLINDTPYHSFHADLYEVATAVLEKERKIDYKNLSGTANILLKQIFKGYNVDVIIASIQEVDLQKKVLLTTTKHVAYDFLVLALGSRANYFGIPGAEEHSHPFKTTEDAINIRNDITELVARHDTPVNIAIAGGGLSGIELAMQMTGFLQKAAYKLQKPVGRVSVIEGSEHVMTGTPQWAQQLGMKRLYDNGVVVYTESHITEVTDRIIVCKGGHRIAYDYLIWTTGVIGNTLKGRIRGIQPTSKQQLSVSSDLRLAEYKEVYVVGDLAYATYPNGKSVPSTAWAAIGMGKHAGHNLLRQLNGESTVPYHPQSPLFVVPLGKKQGLAVVGPIQLRGFIAWLLKRFVSLKYFLSILPPMSAFDLWRKGVRIYIHND